MHTTCSKNYKAIGGKKLKQLSGEFVQLVVFSVGNGPWSGSSVSSGVWMVKLRAHRIEQEDG